MVVPTDLILDLDFASLYRQERMSFECNVSENSYHCFPEVLHEDNSIT